MGKDVKMREENTNFEEDLQVFIDKTPSFD
jgi:hypothetical protein